jgi:hypothetical protein
LVRAGFGLGRTGFLYNVHGNVIQTNKCVARPTRIAPSPDSRLTAGTIAWSCLGAAPSRSPCPRGRGAPLGRGDGDGVPRPF